MPYHLTLPVDETRAKLEELDGRLTGILPARGPDMASDDVYLHRAADAFDEALKCCVGSVAPRLAAAIDSLEYVTCGHKGVVDELLAGLRALVTEEAEEDGVLPFRSWTILEDGVVLEDGPAGVPGDQRVSGGAPRPAVVETAAPPAFTATVQAALAHLAEVKSCPAEVGVHIGRAERCLRALVPDGGDRG